MERTEIMKTGSGDAGKIHVAVIGGGASGMMAAITAARAGAAVTVLEHTDRVGKKILSTGNGKCNFSNRFMEAECFRSDTPAFPMQVIRSFDVDDTVSFFAGLGIVPAERNGYLYPASGQAASVLDVLRHAMEREGVDVRTGITVQDIRKKQHQFRINCGEHTILCDRVILAAGSKAAPKTGSDGSGYVLAEKLGHRVIPPLPALVQLRCRENYYKSVAGVRTEASVSLYSKKGGKERLLAEDRGELQLTDYGISGIPVFQISRYASRVLAEGGSVFCLLDFWPGTYAEAFRAQLSDRRRILRDMPVSEFFTGWFNRKLGDLFLSLEGIDRKKPCGRMTDAEIKALARRIRAFRTEIAGTNSFDQCQVCAGGVDAGEIFPERMESRLVPGLYFAGEIVDVDGICGGYNLQWAWSSGHAAGSCAARP